MNPKVAYILFMITSVTWGSREFRESGESGEFGELEGVRNRGGHGDPPVQGGIHLHLHSALITFHSSLLPLWHVHRRIASKEPAWNEPREM
jgi:hypothetical protein